MVVGGLPDGSSPARFPRGIPQLFIIAGGRSLIFRSAMCQKRKSLFQRKFIIGEGHQNIRKFLKSSSTPRYQVIVYAEHGDKKIYS